MWEISVTLAANLDYGKLETLLSMLLLLTATDGYVQHGSLISPYDMSVLLYYLSNEVA